MLGLKLIHVIKRGHLSTLRLKLIYVNKKDRVLQKGVHLILVYELNSNGESSCRRVPGLKPGTRCFTAVSIGVMFLNCRLQVSLQIGRSLRNCHPFPRILLPILQGLISYSSIPRWAAIANTYRYLIKSFTTFSMVVWYEHVGPWEMRLLSSMGNLHTYFNARHHEHFL